MQSPRTRLSFPLVGFVLTILGFTHTTWADAPTRIDRQALVTRHNVVLRQFDVENPLSVGNGEFAFTADVTGLQTFADAFTKTIPLGTLSQWGWHTAPNPEGWDIDRFQFKEFPDLHGRRVGYADVPGNRQTPEIKWLRANPHRLHLGQIGFLLTKADGKAAEPNDLTDIEQTLDLWNGVLISRFKLDGQPVEVQTICHPTQDLLAVRVTSPLLKQGRICIQIHFPYGTGATTTADWTKPDAHETTLTQPRPGIGASSLADWTTTPTGFRAAGRRERRLAETAKHRFVLTPAKDTDSLEFVCAFSAETDERETADVREDSGCGGEALEPVLAHRWGDRPVRAARTPAGRS